MCWTSLQGKEREVWGGLRQKELSFDEIYDLLCELKSLGTKFIGVIGQGEPLLRKGIIDIFYAIRGLEMQGLLTTNGTLLDEKVSRELVKLDWTKVTFSLDGPSAEFHDQIRGKGVFNRVIENIHRLNEIKQSAKSRRPFLEYNTLIMKNNFFVLDRMIDLAWDTHASRITFLSMYPQSKSCEDLSLTSDDRKVAIECLQRAVEKSEKYGITTNARDILEFGERGLISGNMNGLVFCARPWLSSFINPDGSVLICCFLPTEPIGNIRENSFKEIWYGEKMKQFRKRARSGKLNKDCRFCFAQIVKENNELNMILNKLKLSHSINYMKSLFSRKFM